MTAFRSYSGDKSDKNRQPASVAKKATARGFFVSGRYNYAVLRAANAIFAPIVQKFALCSCFFAAHMLY